MVLLELGMEQAAVVDGHAELLELVLVYVVCDWTRIGTLQSILGLCSTNTVRVGGGLACAHVHAGGDGLQSAYHRCDLAVLLG